MLDIQSNTFTFNFSKPVHVGLYKVNYVKGEKSNLLQVKKNYLPVYKDVFCGKWKASTTPDGLYLICHKDIYKDFENIYNYHSTYTPKSHYNIVVRGFDSEAESMREFNAIQTACNSANYLDNIDFKCDDKTDAEFIEIGDIVKNDKSVEKIFIDACSNYDLLPTLSKSKNNSVICKMTKNVSTYIDIIYLNSDTVAGIILRPENTYNYRSDPFNANYIMMERIEHMLS